MRGPVSLAFRFVFLSRLSAARPFRAVEVMVSGGCHRKIISNQKLPPITKNFPFSVGEKEEGGRKEGRKEGSKEGRNEGRKDGRKEGSKEMEWSCCYDYYHYYYYN